MTLKNYVNGAFVPAWNGNVQHERFDEAVGDSRHG